MGVTANPFPLKMVGFELPVHGRFWVPGDTENRGVERITPLRSHTLLADESQALEALPPLPPVFDDDTANTEQQTLRATGTDDTPRITFPLPQTAKTKPRETGESVLPSGLPKSVAQKGSRVYNCALPEPSGDKPAIATKNPENTGFQGDSSGESGIRTRGPDCSEHRISNPAHSATLASLRVLLLNVSLRSPNESCVFCHPTRQPEAVFG